VIRAAKCVVPDHPDALPLLRKQLLHFDKDSWAANSDEIQKFRSSELQNPDTRSEAAPFSQHELHNGMDNLNISTDSLGLDDEIKSLSSLLVCTEYFVTIVFVNGSIYSISTDCISYVIEEDSSGGGGGGGGSDPDPGDCDPTLPCFDGPGGSQPPPSVDDPEPCDTDDEIIDNPNVNGEFPSIWEATNFGDEINPNPLDQRMETAMWVIQDGIDLITQPFPEDWIFTACGIGIPEETNLADVIPDNLIGWVHTHPFREGEDTRPVCGSDADSSYTSGFSFDDFEFHLDLANATGNFSLTAIMIDNQKILKMDVFQNITSFNRCGF